MFASQDLKCSFASNSTEVIVLKMPDSRCSPVEAADGLFGKYWKFRLKKEGWKDGGCDMLI